MTRTSQRLLPSLGVAGLAGLLAVAVAGPADARGKREEAAAELAAARLTGPPLMAVVSLGDQRITIYDAEGKILQAPVSTGRTRLRDAGRHLQRHPEERGSTTPTSITMPPCRSCSASPGRASPCMPARCPAIPPRTAASACRYGFAEQLFDLTKLGHARGGGARRHAPRRVLPSGALQARPDPRASRGRRARSGHLGGRSADATHAARCAAACSDSGAADLARGCRRSPRGGREVEREDRGGAPGRRQGPRRVRPHHEVGAHRRAHRAPCRDAACPGRARDGREEQPGARGEEGGKSARP